MHYFLTVNYFSIGLIQKLLISLQDQGSDFILIVVNNSPHDPNIGLLQNWDTIVLESGGNVGFGAACNVGLAWIWHRSRQATVWLINPDATLPPGMVGKCDRVLANHPEVTILGTNIYETTGLCTFTGGLFYPWRGEIKAVCYPESYGLQETNWISGCSLILRLAGFSQCPSFDPTYFLYYEDFDFCQRYRQQGHRIYIYHDLFVLHQTSTITSRNPNQKVFQEITSYLLALRQYSPWATVLFRILRITIGAVPLFLIGNIKARMKLVALWKFRNQIC